MNLLNIVYFILILSVIIIIHELGHLITAKAFGVYCEEFAIGMGPRIFKKQFKETTFSIRLLPLGGFVAMAGEEGVDKEDIPFERTIKGIAWWKQIIVMAAGAIMNILLAWSLLIGVTALQGKVEVPPEPIIQSVVENSPAAKAGIQANDRIVSLTSRGETMQPKTFNDVIKHFQFYPKDAVELVLERNNSTVHVQVQPVLNEETDRYGIGIFSNPPTIKNISFFESISYGTKSLIDSTKDIFFSLGKLIKGIGVENLSGPVGIYQISAQATSAGLIPVLFLIAILSLNIGIFNLLPLPVLDGGRIFITLIEKIVGRQLNKKAEAIIMSVGVVLLVGLMLFATFQDVLRLM